MSEYVDRIPAHKSAVWRGEGALLPHLDVELTERCNNDCIHCCVNLPANDESARLQELTTEEIKRILREAVDLGCLQVRFTGGEPLLRGDFEELYVFARRLGMKVQLFTNARLITPRLADLFIRTPPLVEIEVTVYGMKAESYEAATGVAGSFVQFRRGFQLLLDKKIPFIVKGALLPPNHAEVEEFEAWAATIPWMKEPPLYSIFFDLRRRHDSPNKNRQIASMRISPDDAILFLDRRSEEHRRRLADFCQRFLGPLSDSLFLCGAGREGCVDAYGRYRACMILCAPAWTYDLRSGSLSDAISKLLPRLKEARATNPEYLRRCGRCFLRSLCQQCPGRSWTENGTLDTPIEYFCAVAHAEARALGLIGIDEQAWNVVDFPLRTRTLKTRARGSTGLGRDRRNGHAEEDMG